MYHENLLLNPSVSCTVFTWEDFLFSIFPYIAVCIEQWKNNLLIIFKQKTSKNYYGNDKSWKKYQYSSLEILISTKLKQCQSAESQMCTKYFEKFWELAVSKPLLVFQEANKYILNLHVSNFSKITEQKKRSALEGTLKTRGLNEYWELFCFQKCYEKRLCILDLYRCT